MTRIDTDNDCVSLGLVLHPRLSGLSVVLKKLVCISLYIELCPLVTLTGLLRGVEENLKLFSL